jgi:hypothetical protein
MIRVIITPKSKVNLYRLMKKKEIELRRKNMGTLHRSDIKKQKGYEKWMHKSHVGWIWFQRCLGNMISAEIQSRNINDEWQLLSSFIGFMDRHFRKEISSINLSYDS